MSFIHSKSGECLKSELDLFEVMPTQTSIESSAYIEISPLAALSPNAPIEFFVASSAAPYYLDMDDCMLHLVCKVVKEDGTAINNDARVAPIAYPIATLFNQLDITLGDRLITQSDNLYAYRAYIEALLNYSNETLHNQMTAG